MGWSHHAYARLAQQISGERPMGVASGTAAAAVWAGGGGGVVRAALAMPSRPPGLMVTPAGSGGLPNDGAAGSTFARGLPFFPVHKP